MHTPQTLGYCMNFVIRNAISSIQRDEASSAMISELKYDQLENMVGEVNAICEDLLPDRHCHFVLPNNRSNIFWKLTLNIFCRFKRYANAYQIRAIPVKEFIFLHSELRSIHICLQNKPTSTQTVKDFSQEEEEEEFCCICFERVPDLLLPCMHIFCQTCIQNWHGSLYQLPSSRPSWLPHQAENHSDQPSQENRSNCPICRKKFSNPKSAWQMVEYQKPEAYQRFLRQHARRLVEKSGHISTTCDLFQET